MKRRPSTTARTPGRPAVLAARPVENSVPRTICGALRRRGLDAYGTELPLFGWWRPDGGDAGTADTSGVAGGEVAAAFLRTPPHPPLLTRGPADAFRALAAVLDGPLPGVRGDGEAARAFADAWRDRTGGSVRVTRETRVYRLGELTPRRTAPPGGVRIAGPADRELLVRWYQEFAAEIGEEVLGGARTVDDALAYGGRFLWEVEGEPVAMAGSTVPEDGAVRVVAVYTPAEHRGRGYAGAVTAAVSRAALDAGAGDVLLSADLANPVSTGLYQRLGYVAVRDHVAVGFEGPGGERAA